MTEDIHAGARGVAPAVATPAAAEPEPEAEEEGNCFGASLAQEESSDESSDEDDARDESELQHKLAMSLGYSSAPTPKHCLRRQARGDHVEGATAAHLQFLTAEDTDERQEEQ